MIIGVGVDIVEISRLENKKDDQNFLSKIYTKTELLYILVKQNPTPSLASHFAAKEALLKAIGTGIGYGFSTLDVEVMHGAMGEPYYIISKKILEYFKDKKIKAHLSITHEKHYAVAFAVLESVN